MLSGGELDLPGTHVADLDASLVDGCLGRRWIKARRPELYQPLTVPTGQEADIRAVRFDKKGV